MRKGCYPIESEGLNAKIRLSRGSQQLESQKNSKPDQTDQSWFRRYPPITVALASAILIAFIVLPSALNVPQTNPTTIAEYAPVPPGDDVPPDTTGNVSALGLGSSSSLQRGVPAAGGAEAPTAGGRRLQNKRCVGKPPRQAEDPMSPPCVPFFEGDNGGSTYQGVTRDEIVVLVLSDSGGRNTGDSSENSGPAGSYCDVDLPPNTGGPGCYVAQTNQDHGWIKFIRAFSRYFNRRYQTYGRHVHFWHHWSNVATNPGVKRSEAADNYTRLKPFAVLDQTSVTGSDDAYYDAITRRRVMVTTGSALSAPTAAANYQRRSPFLWGFIPDVEHWMQAFTNYICTKVAPFPVKHAQGGVGTGGPMNGRARRIALIYDNTGGISNEFRHAASLLEPSLREQCGVSFVAKIAYSDDSQAGVYLAELRQKDATTLLVVGSLVTLTLFAEADSSGYYPEVVFAGDGVIDRNLSGRLYPDNFMRNAWLMTYLIGSQRLEEDYAFLACIEGDPSLSRAACQLGATKYQDYQLLFKMIQTSGPRLRPSNVDRGMHSIPRQSSNSRAEAACFYEPNDYTCIKDAMEEWWDNSGRSPSSSSPGCWRMVRGGVRYLPGTWPRADEVFTNGDQDPCNAYTLGGAIDP